jgi:hypothetical protein
MDGDQESVETENLSIPLAAQSDQTTEVAKLHDLLAQEAEQEIDL